MLLKFTLQIPGNPSQKVALRPSPPPPQSVFAFFPLTLFYVDLSFSLLLFFLDLSFSLLLFFLDFSFSLLLFFLDLSFSLLLFFLDLSFSFFIPIYPKFSPPFFRILLH